MLEFLRNIHKPIVLCGEFALSWLGCTTSQPYTVQAWSDLEIVCGIDTAFIKYYYNENIQKDKDVSIFKDYANVFLPSEERAVIEAVKFLDYFEEGIVFESIVRSCAEESQLKVTLEKIPEYCSGKEIDTVKQYILDAVEEGCW